MGAQVIDGIKGDFCGGRRAQAAREQAAVKHDFFRSDIDQYAMRGIRHENGLSSEVTI
ncbi:TPA: hypothetical protein PZN16_003071 [Staphylococcus aureus]|nr:hypothetical protein [Staphylococcus aureus]